MIQMIKHFITFPIEFTPLYHHRKRNINKVLCPSSIPTIQTLQISSTNSKQQLSQVLKTQQGERNDVPASVTTYLLFKLIIYHIIGDYIAFFQRNAVVPLTWYTLGFNDKGVSHLVGWRNIS